MTTLFKIFLRQCFAGQPHIGRLLAVNGVLFAAFYLSECRLTIAPFVFYLTSALFTAGLMHQALSSTKLRDMLQHLLMLPHDNRAFVCAYVTALGCHTLLTKTLSVWLIFAALGHFSMSVLLLSLLAASCGIVITSILFSRDNGYGRTLLTAIVALAILAFVPRPAVAAIVFILTLLFGAQTLAHCRTDSFYRRQRILTTSTAIHHHFLLPRYFFRYLITHKNYIVNTVFLWGLAALLPLFARELAPFDFSSMAFALLTLNTPLGILLSCDPNLQQALHALPGQTQTFCLPYVTFLFSCNLIANSIFLCSSSLLGLEYGWQTIAHAIFFAVQSAICTVWLEWRHPIRHWQLESDLWHHPRKYLVPCNMLLLAGLFGIYPKLSLYAFFLLGFECLIFFCIQKKKYTVFLPTNRG